MCKMNMIFFFALPFSLYCKWTLSVWREKYGRNAKSTSYVLAVLEQAKSILATMATPDTRKWRKF